MYSIDDGTGDEGTFSSPRARRMRELGAVVDRLVDAERDLATAAARRAAIVEEARLLTETDAACNAIEAADAGRPRSESGWSTRVVAWRELVSEIACALRIPERTAETLIAHSRALVNDLPATRVALSAGEISYRHAEKLIDHAYSLPSEARSAFEQAALPFARELTVTKFDKKARIVREKTHPESIAVRAAVTRELRDVYCDPARDGMAYLTAYLPAEVAVAGLNRIDDIAASLKGPEETRTQAQLRADVFGDLVIDGITDPVMMTMPRVSFAEEDIPALAEQHLAELDRMGIDGDLGQIITDLTSELDHQAAEQHRVWASLDGIGHGIVARVMVTVPALTLLERADDPATLEGYGPIDPETARKLAAGAPSWSRILTHPENGTSLSIGRDSYAVPADLERLLQYRDETCRHPGCSRRVEGCDLDHSRDWLYGGETAHDNLAHLCRGHHHLKHHTRWRYRHADDAGTLRFTSPAGREYTTRPANRFRSVHFE